MRYSMISHILVVEDIPANVKLLEIRLWMNLYEVLTAFSTGRKRLLPAKVTK